MQVNIQNIKQMLENLQSVPDHLLEQELRKVSVESIDEKFHSAFSAYGASKLLLILDQDKLRSGLAEIPDAALEGIRWNSALIIRAYVSFVYMRSEVLERGLDEVPETSPLRPFRDTFRSGSRDEMTMVQHMRNSLSHGTFVLSDDLASVHFKDRKWEETISVKDVFALCEQIYRFYNAAFRVKHGLA